MKENIGRFEATIRQLTAVACAEREVRLKMFPRLVQGPEPQYPLGSKDEMVQSYTFAALDLDAELVNLMSAAATMPQPYGDMFCYVAYCDLHQRMKMYQRLAAELLQSGEGALVPGSKQDISLLA